MSDSKCFQSLVCCMFTSQCTRFIVQYTSLCMSQTLWYFPRFHQFLYHWVIKPHNTESLPYSHNVLLTFWKNLIKKINLKGHNRIQQEPTGFNLQNTFMYTQNKRAYSRNCAWEFRRQMAPISKLRSSKRRNFSQKEVTSGNRIPEERSLAGFW